MRKTKRRSWTAGAGLGILLILTSGGAPPASAHSPSGAREVDPGLALLLDDRIDWHARQGQSLSMTFVGMTLTQGFCRVIAGESDLLSATFGAQSMVCDLLLEDGDRAHIGGSGAADGTESVGGSVTGFAFPPERKVTCRNLTTLQAVQFFTGSDSWDCEQEGLRVSTGDRIVQSVVGEI